MAKKNTISDVKDTTVKPAEVKAPAEAKAAEAKTETAAKTAAPKAEKKTDAKKPGRKPAAKKETAVKTEKKPAAKKDTAAKTEKKPAAKKPAAKKTEAAKSTSRKGKAAAKTEEKAAPAKRGGGRKKQLSYGEIIEAARTKAMAADTTKIKVHIAANIVLKGSFSANGNENESSDQFYIEINPETESIIVQPYRYEENTFQIEADAEELFKVLKGKKNIYDALSDGDIHVHGKTKPAILFIHSVL